MMVGITINHQRLEKKFGKEAMKHRLVLKPGTPRFVAIRSQKIRTNLEQKNMQLKAVDWERHFT